MSHPNTHADHGSTAEEALTLQELAARLRLLEKAFKESQLVRGDSHRAKPAPGERGSKEAVLPYCGVFQDDGDLEEQLAALRAMRKAAGE